MRVVGGKHKRRPLQAPPGLDTRPTSDRTRESLFNILAHHSGVTLSGARAMDIFAGTGALGFEALSRGAAWLDFIDNGAEAVRCIQSNGETLGEAENFKAWTCDATKPLPAGLRSNAAELVFMDPPYGRNLISAALTNLSDCGCLSAESLIIAEMGSGEEIELPDGFEAFDERSYGEAKILFMKMSG